MPHIQKKSFSSLFNWRAVLLEPIFRNCLPPPGPITTPFRLFARVCGFLHLPSSHNTYTAAMFGSRFIRRHKLGRLSRYLFVDFITDSQCISFNLLGVCCRFCRCFCVSISKKSGFAFFVRTSESVIVRFIRGASSHHDLCAF